MHLHTVDQIVAEREDIFGQAVQSADANTTPIVRGTKKRKKVKQHPTPSPTKHQPDPKPDHRGGVWQVDEEVVTNHPGDDNPLTAEEIARLYEEEDPDEN